MAGKRCPFRSRFALGLLFAFGVIIPSYADDRPRSITVHLSEYRFEPPRIELAAGQEVELVLINDGTLLHEFVTDALKNLEVGVTVQGTVAETLGIEEIEIPPRGVVMLHFAPKTPGEFPVVCHAKKPKDHLKEGMAGQIVIR